MTHLAAAAAAPPALLGVPVEMLLFGATLLGVALFHHRTLLVASLGLACITVWKVSFTGFDLLAHLGHEWPLVANLLGLLLGFALLAEYFRESQLPDVLPRLLPDDWKGGLVLLALVWVLSSFLDNIAAAMIGGTLAAVVYGGRVHTGFLAAIVAASNAGGAWSVVGDTTTTMMWIAGRTPGEVAHALVGSLAALLTFGGIAALQQHRHQPIQKDPKPGVRVDGVRVAIVAAILLGAIAANVAIGFPAAGVWGAILLGVAFRKPAWSYLPVALRGACFLLALVLAASMMPVEELPAPSWRSTFALGAISAVFDNIPLTKLALDQGGYDWGLLAYAVGFGGSMMWFGSSAGVALATMYPQARSAAGWLRYGWHVPLAYVAGFAALLAACGFSPA